MNIVEIEQWRRKDPAFDEYDRENGYEDELEEPEENQWKVCGEDCRPCCKNCDSAFEKLIQSVHERKHCHVVGILAF